MSSFADEFIRDLAYSKVAHDTMVLLLTVENEHK